MAEEREVKMWITVHGKHVPLFEGESKADAIGRAFKNTSASKDADKKESTIAKQKSEADRLNSEDKYRDSVKSSGKATIKDGKIMFNGKPVDKLDVSTPGEKSSKGTTDGSSLADHLKNGELTPERQEVHRQIIENYFKGHQPYGPNDEKVAMFTGGGGASGKGTFTKVGDDGHRNIGDYYSQDKNPLVIDADEIKKELAKADGRVIDDTLTGYYHEESSSLAKQIYATSLQNNYPTLFDGTATGVGSALKKVDMAHKYGYKAEMCFLYSDWETVRENSLGRYENTGRLVPLGHLTKAHRDAYDAVVAQQDKYDSFKLYDNAGRKMKLVGTSSLGKQLTIKDKESWDKFSKSKADFTLSPEETSKYNRRAAAITKKRGGK